MILSMLNHPNIYDAQSIRQYQKVAVVNYPNNYDYTRITEFKHFYRRQTSNTVIAKEFPASDGDPSYPIPTKGEYQYYSMDQIVEKMLSIRVLNE